jgi:hypothetical protein
MKEKLMCFFEIARKTQFIMMFTREILKYNDVYS